MLTLTSIADWWDKKRKESNLTLEQIVESNPNQFGIIVATGLHTSMELGSGFVDLLRLGDGVAQGTVKGVAQDGLRVIGIATGPLGKRAIKFISTTSHIRLAKAIKDPGGPICSWIAATKALAQTGHRTAKGKIFAAVDDLKKSRWRTGYRWDFIDSNG